MPRPDKDEDYIVSIDYDRLSHILLTSGNVFEVVPGTYKEYKPRGGEEVYSVTSNEFGPERQMVGPTRSILAMWFEPPSTTE